MPIDCHKGGAHPDRCFARHIAHIVSKYAAAARGSKLQCTGPHPGIAIANVFAWASRVPVLKGTLVREMPSGERFCRTHGGIKAREMECRFGAARVCAHKSLGSLPLRPRRSTKRRGYAMFRETKTTAHPRLRHDERRFHHPDFDKMQARGWKAAEAEAKIGDKRWKEELERGLKNGLPGA